MPSSVFTTIENLSVDEAINKFTAEKLDLAAWADLPLKFNKHWNRWVIG
jgi:hypothetical protein